jgi:hypothetical protein
MCLYVRGLGKATCCAGFHQPAQVAQMVIDHWLSERKLMSKDLRKAYDSLFLLVFLFVSLIDLQPCRLGHCQRLILRQDSGWK